MIIVSMFIGWPAIVGSLILAIAGIISNRYYLLAVSAVLISGFSLYLFGSPSPVFYITGAALPIFHLVAYFLVKEGKKWAAALSIAPHLAITLYLAFAITG